MNTKLIPTDSTETAKQYYAIYGEYVNATRAFPSIYDGLKLVHRRIIYTANQLPEKNMKVAELSGLCMRIHPHSSPDGSVVTLGTPCNNVQIIHTKGNWGGWEHGAAASRYIEGYLNSLGRFMHCQFNKYAEYIMGEINHEEPKALPSLLPYALYNGSSGMGIGASGNICPLNVMDLIDYYEDVVKNGSSDRLVRPDLGPVIIDMDEADLKSSVNSYKSSIRVYSSVTQESDTVLVVQGFSDRMSIDKLLNKMGSWITDGQVDYRNETTTTRRYVFEIVDKSLKASQVKKFIEKATTTNNTYSRAMTDNVGVVYATLSYVAKESLKCLNDAIDKMISKGIDECNHKLELYNSLDLAKSKKIFDKVTKKSTEEIIQSMIDIGIREEVAKEIIKKPISYLTRDHNDEQDYYAKLLDEYTHHNRVEYLIRLYEELRAKIQDQYDSKPHSIMVADVLINPKVAFRHGVLDVGAKRGGYSFDNSIYLVSEDGWIYQSSVSSTTRKQLDVSATYGTTIVGIATDTHRYIVITTQDADKYKYKLGIDLQSFKYNKQYLSLTRKGEKIISVDAYSESDAPSYISNILKTKVSKAIYNKEFQ